MALSEGASRRRGVWTKEYSDGSKLFYSTAVQYETGQGGGGLNPSSLKTYVLYQRDRGLTTEWVTGGVLGVDGKFTPLRNSESFRVTEGGLERLGTGGLYDYPANDYVLGELARRDLVAEGRTSLGYQTINNAKYLLQKDTGESADVINRAYDISSNIAPPGQTGAPSILGPPQGGNPAPTLREEPNTGVEPNENNIQNDVLVNGQLEIARPYIQYPEKMTLSQPNIKFQALKYRRSGENGQIDRENNATITNPLEFKFGNAQFSPADGPVYISIQSSISDQNSVDWGPDSVNAIDSAVYKASYDLMQSNSSDQLSSKLQGYMGDAQTQLRKYSDRTRRYLAGQAASINNVLARTDGVILNPNLELLFQGPQLRPFSFQLKLSARNINEAAIVKKIIKYFKYHMASRQEKGLFLRSPNVFGIEYLSTLKSSHSGLNRIKECALTNFSVDYTPLGSYMSYYDDTMVAYTLNLQFQELTPIYDTNYTEADTIGF